MIDQNTAIALGSLVLTVGLAVGIMLITQGASTNTQLDIFQWTNTPEELDEKAVERFFEKRNFANLQIALGSIVTGAGYALGMIIIRKFSKKPT